MKTLKVGLRGLAIVGVVAGVLLGCSSGPSGPSTAEVSKALVSMSSAQYTAGAPSMSKATYTGNTFSQTYNNGGGSVTVTYQRHAGRSHAVVSCRKHHLRELV